MGNSDFSAIINGVQHFASDMEQLVGHAVDEITNLGIGMFNGMEWFIHFLIQLQEDPMHVISRMAVRIAEIGASVASVLEEIVNGIRANGLIGYLRINVQNALTPFHGTMNQQVTRSNQLTTLHQNTVSTMKQKLNTLKNNGPDASWRGQSVDAMSASFDFHSATLTDLSGVFNNQNSVTNTYALNMEIDNFMALIAVFAIIDLLIILCGVVGIAFTFGTSTIAMGELLTLAVIGEVAILLIYAEVYNLAWQHSTSGLYQGATTTTTTTSPAITKLYSTIKKTDDGRTIRVRKLSDREVSKLKTPWGTEFEVEKSKAGWHANDDIYVDQDGEYWIGVRGSNIVSSFP